MLEFIVYYEALNYQTVLLLTNNRGKQVSTTIPDSVFVKAEGKPSQSYEVVVRKAIQILIESWLIEYDEEVEWVENDEFLGFQYVNVIDGEEV